MYIQGVDSVYDSGSGATAWLGKTQATCSIRTKWSNPPITSNTRMWTSCSPASSSTRKRSAAAAAGAGDSAAAARLRAYSEKAAHSFNLLDARKAISAD